MKSRDDAVNKILELEDLRTAFNKKQLQIESNICVALMIGIGWSIELGSDNKMNETITALMERLRCKI